jgi:hypothetical protein
MRGEVLLAASSAEVVAPLLHASVGLSFWGGVCPQTSEVIDRHHPLHGERLENCVLALPSGRGSCTGSQVILELLLAGRAPSAILLRQRDEIICLGVIVAQELFGRAIPIVSLGEHGFDALSHAAQAGCEGVRVHPNGTVELLPGEGEAAAAAADAAALPPMPTPTPTPTPTPVRLSRSDLAMLAGAEGAAAAVAMRIVKRVAELQGASELLSVSQVHIDGCTYIGEASLMFARRLVDSGGRVRVPTSLNAISVDQRRWRELGVRPALGEPASALGDAYVELGATPTFTCAPYLLEGSAPAAGEHIGWGESNAVVFANSCLGARTQKTADFLDVCIALTGRAPAAGVHLDCNRRARLVLSLPNLDAATLDDSFYPTLGYLCGLEAEGRVPVVTGLETASPTRDDLKAFSAAFGTTASTPLFHLAGVTPEAPDVATALGGDDHGSSGAVRRSISRAALAAAFSRLNSSSASEVQLGDLISW